MQKTCRQMIRELKRGINLNIELGTLGSDIENMLVSCLDDAMNVVVDEMLTNDPMMLCTYFDLTLDGSEAYYIPDSAKYDCDTVQMIEEITGGADTPFKTVYTVWGDRLQYRHGDIVTDREPWNKRDNYIEFPLKPSAGTMRIWHTRRPTGLFYATAASGTTTTATLPATMSAGELLLTDDVYNGMKAVVSTQVRTITDYVASTRTLTFAALSGAVSSTTVVDLMYPLPERYLQHIIDVAIRRWRIGSNEDDTPIARYNAEFKATMGHSLKKKTTQSPKFIRKIR